MQDLISRKNWYYDLDPGRKNFTLKGWFHYWAEKLTGRRFFEYKNYKVVR
jgi:hypothetical protein